MLVQVTLSIILFLQMLHRSSEISLKSSTSKPPQSNNHQNISNLLDNLLSGYDNSVRPDFGGPPAVVEVDIMVRSMGPISEVDMTYSMDCYFRQSWIDRRLAFSGNSSDTLALSISMLARIWKPDTYFYNGKQSYLHTITTPNKFVRLYQDGRVLYSSRLTIKAGCPMNLEDFPMDIQRCPLKFGSFGYTNQDVIYKWNQHRQVAIAEDMKLSQFDLIATPAANNTDTLPNSDTLTGYRPSINTPIHLTEYSMLLVSFHLQRHMGNFLIQVYGPCVLLVVLSWVSFWLNREATADRVSLGITTVLTMTFLGLEARTDLPKVPYPTALDFFVFLSFSFIFATIIQFAVVHYFTKYGSGECYFSSDFNSDSSSDEEDWVPVEKEVHTPTISGSSTRKNSTALPYASYHTNDHLLEVIPLSACTIPLAPARRSSWSTLSACIGKSETNSNYISGPEPAISANKPPYPNRSKHHRKKRRTPRFNSVSKIDRASRIFFPLLFITINMFYWYSYLSRTNRIQNLNVK
ncbi:gamma-aminobutyric acid receptor alpha-like [Aethina tumida]|uniref:gamma-aminobutyric acid receptor alpha-like n=1 Tax=Aethina tumida TaxID=116153 RepID=UPI002148180F|nr:gamma-aminobutyric acid receptor alpha-like [Aethina tumida]